MAWRMVLVSALLTVMTTSACKKPGETVGGSNLAGAPVSEASGIAKDISQRILSLTPGAPDKLAADVQQIVDWLKEQSIRDPIAKVYYAAIRPFPKLRGIVPRLRVLGDKSQVAQSFVLGLLYSMKYSSYTQSPHIQAIENYLLTPVPGVVPFQTVSELQDWLTNDLQTEIQASLSDIDGLAKSNFPEFSFDRAIGYSSDAKMTSAQRYKIFHKSYLSSAAAALRFVSGAIYYFAAYDLDQLLMFQNAQLQMTKLNQNYDASGPGLAASSLGHSRTIIENFTTPAKVHTGLQIISPLKLLKLRANGAANLEKSWQQLGAAVNANRTALNEVIALEAATQNSDGDKYLFNPKASLINRAQSEANLNDLIKMFQSKQPVDITSPVTGETFKINVWALFDGSKANVQDRAKGYPNKFVEGSPLSGDGANYVINYDIGRPTAWPDPTFGGFLPGATNANIYSVLKNLSLTPSTGCFSQAIPVPTNHSTSINVVPALIYNCFM